MRYQRYQDLLNSSFFTSHSTSRRTDGIGLNRIDLRLGLFKASPQLLLHSMILTTLTSQPARLQYQFHGKRQKRTVSLDVNLPKKFAWPFLERLLHEILPRMYDLKTIKHRRSLGKSKTIALRFREQTSQINEIDDLVEPFMWDAHRGIFLPLTLHFQLARAESCARREVLLRGFRLPIHFFKRREIAAFDDALTVASKKPADVKKS